MISPPRPKTRGGENNGVAPTGFGMESAPMVKFVPHKDILGTPLEWKNEGVMDGDVGENGEFILESWTQNPRSPGLTTMQDSPAAPAECIAASRRYCVLCCYVDRAAVI